jgi:hypothetical protein
MKANTNPPRREREYQVGVTIPRKAREILHAQHDPEHRHHQAGRRHANRSPDLNTHRGEVGRRSLSSKLKPKVFTLEDRLHPLHAVGRGLTLRLDSTQQPSG